MKRPFAAISVLVILALTISCGGTRMEPRQMVALNLQPASATPASGVDVQFSATGSFNKPPTPVRVNPIVWIETAADGLLAGNGVAVVDQSGLAHCNRTGRTWITATAYTGTLNQYRDPALVRGTAQLECP
jgi:hypothetical protein